MGNTPSLLGKIYVLSFHRNNRFGITNNFIVNTFQLYSPLNRNISCRIKMSSVLQCKNCYSEKHILNQNKIECMTSECRNTSPFFFLTPGVTLTGWQGTLGLTPQKLWGEQLEGNFNFSSSHLASRRETMTEAFCFLRRLMTARGGLKNFLVSLGSHTVAKL